jgi:hypothetical protein
MPRKRKGGASTVSQAQDSPTSRPSERPGNETEERRGDAVRSEEEERLRREVGDLKRLVDRQAAEVGKLKREEEMLREKCKRRDEWIVGLEQEMWKVRDSYQGVVEEHLRRIRGLEEQLKETEEQLATRPTLPEPSGTQTFPSMTDRLSGVEVLSIVRDLNENIFQVAVNLTEEWERLDPAQVTDRADAGSRVPVLVRLTRDRDPTGLTFLLQSCLCSRAVDITSSWGRYKELAVLVSVYQRLSTSGEHHVVDPRSNVTHTP